MKKIETLFGLVGLTVALAGCPGDDSGDTSTTDAATTDAETTTGTPTCDPACADGEECIDGVCFPTGGDTTTDDPPPGNSDYGPCDSCAAGEMPVAIDGLEGCFCSPSCDGAMAMCPPPNEGTGQAQCVLGVDPMSPTQCALLCDPAGDNCPPGATCQDTGMGVGLCTHPAP